MFSLKKIASVVMATAMAVTTAVPGTAIVANAETTTIKTPSFFQQWMLAKLLCRRSYFYRI